MNQNVIYTSQKCMHYPAFKITHFEMFSFSFFDTVEGHQLDHNWLQKRLGECYEGHEAQIYHELQKVLTRIVYFVTILSVDTETF